jgi:hypothetical protein
MPQVTERHIVNSVQNRLYEILRQTGWYQTFEAQPLVRQATPGYIYTLAGSAHPWVFMDEYGYPDNTIAVYVDGVEVSRPAFSIDYLGDNQSGGRVIFAADPGGAVTIDVSVFVVRVIDSYPHDDQLTTMKVPLMAVDLTTAGGRSFHIGSTMEIETYAVTIDILSRNKGERFDLTQRVRRLITRLPIVDMVSTPYFTPGRDLHADFDLDDAFMAWGKFLKRPDSRILPERTNGLPQRKFASTVTVEIVATS